MNPGRWLTLAVVSAATAMLLLDVTVVNVALPAIRADLDASFAELQWVVDAYALTLAATLLTTGALADRHGRRAVFAAGLIVFTACSALCAAAGSGVMLDVARAAQGIGAAAMFAASLALLAHEFQGAERGFAIGVISPALAAAMVGVLSADQVGLASGINNTFRQLGIAVGIAVLGAVFTHHAGGGLPGLVDGLNAVFTVAAAVAAAGAVIAWLLLGDFAVPRRA